MIKFFIFKFFSNAFFKCDKSIIIFIGETYVKPLTNMISVEHCSLFFIVFYAILLIIILLDWKRLIAAIIFIDVYIYLACNFILWCDGNGISSCYTYLIIFASVITIIILKINGLEKNGFLVNIFKVFLSHILFILGIVLSLFITKEINYIFLSVLTDNDIPYGSYIFIMFSLLIPRVIIFRIIINAIFNCIYTGRFEISILLVYIVTEIFNSDNYKISNIRVSKSAILFLFTAPLIDLFLSTIKLMPFTNSCESINVSNTSINPCFLYSPSYEELTYPHSKEFIQEIRLNIEQSRTKGELELMGAIPVPIQYGEGNLSDCRYIFDDKFWVRSNNNLFFEESYIKRCFTASIDTFCDNPNIEFSYDLENSRNYLTNKGVLNALQAVRNNINDESLVDTVIATLLPVYFGIDRGYCYTPQARFTESNFNHVKVDYMVSYEGVPVIMVEDKTTNTGSSSFLDLIEQGRTYVRSNPSYETTFLMATKGTQVAFFIFDQDWHSDKKMDLKCDRYNDLIGLEVNTNGISPIIQYNTYHPQAKIYQMGDFNKPNNVFAITSILSYISQFKRGVGIQDDFTLPSNDYNSNIVLGNSTKLGLQFRLEIDPYGRFKHHKI